MEYQQQALSFTVYMRVSMYNVQCTSWAAEYLSLHRSTVDRSTVTVENMLFRLVVAIENTPIDCVKTVIYNHSFYTFDWCILYSSSKMAHASVRF